MSKWFLYVMLSPLMTPQERVDTQQYYRQQRKSFCARHFIADMPPELEKLEQELDQQEEEDRKNGP